ncbi:hypothetical protein dqs_1794 [Azoarcus olearius]|nr:hypothetical protein dqs_1794 [Azoarcus olearius]
MISISHTSPLPSPPPGRHFGAWPTNPTWVEQIRRRHCEGYTTALASTYATAELLGIGLDELELLQAAA